MTTQITKHTPEPWIHHKNQSGKRTIVPDSTDGRLTEHGNGGLQICSLDGPDAFANARLIAAAPELLAACQAALLRDDIADGELGDQLRAAISKATA